MTAVRRLSAVALSLALLGGKAALCAGWAATPEARMECCAEGSECPMHAANSHHAGSKRALTQAQADACCAASERERSSQPNPAAVVVISSAVLGTGVVVPARAPALVLTDGWRTDPPIPIRGVHRHVLLSVFLV